MVRHSRRSSAAGRQNRSSARRGRGSGGPAGPLVQRGDRAVLRRRRPGPDRPRGSCADRCRATRRLLPRCVSGLLDRRPSGLPANRDLLGRTAPDPVIATTLPSAFRLGGPVSAERVVTDVSREPATQRTPSSVRLPFSLDYLASVHIRMKSRKPSARLRKGLWSIGFGLQPKVWWRVRS